MPPLSFRSTTLRPLSAVLSVGTALSADAVATRRSGFTYGSNLPRGAEQRSAGSGAAATARGSSGAAPTAITSVTARPDCPWRAAVAGPPAVAAAGTDPAGPAGARSTAGTPVTAGARQQPAGTSAATSTASTAGASGTAVATVTAGTAGSADTGGFAGGLANDVGPAARTTRSAHAPGSTHASGAAGTAGAAVADQ